MFFGQELMCNFGPTSLGAKMKSEAQIENNRLFQEMFNRFSNIAVTRLDWTGLPPTVSERFLNQVLYLFGYAAFFDDPNLGLLALPCTMAGEYNMYYEPTRVNAYSFNYNRMLNKEDFVLIRNNPTATPTAWSVFEYTRRMSDTIRTIDVLCKKMKNPFIFLCEEKQRQTVLNLVKKIIDNEIVVIGQKNFDLKDNSLTLLETDTKQDLLKLWDVFHNYETLLYTSLGIESVGQEKKERLIVDEVNSNNMVTEMCIEVNIKELEVACEAINNKYGLNVSVRAKGIQEYREGGKPSGDLYDNPQGAD